MEAIQETEAQPCVTTTEQVCEQVISFDIGIRNFAYCIMNKRKDGSFAISHLDLIDLGCRKNEPHKIMERVIDVLDGILYSQLDVSIPLVVLIESQMTSAMKAVQTTINAFFKITSKYTNMPVTTKYMSPKHKLKLVEMFSEEYQHAASTASSQYKKNKEDAVGFALWYLENKEENKGALQRVLKEKKKDDLSDTVLMCVYHCMA